MSQNKRWKFQMILMVIAIGIMVYGICRGEVSVVWNKAVNICLECIGLG
ncbi:MAG: CD1871A family CXXC motif-containing protein [Lachnospiraceae bacterium]|nr:CD1871A family CXXC motif-containing protein [Lachnospiraceae bacterium]